MLRSEVLEELHQLLSAAVRESEAKLLSSGLGQPPRAEIAASICTDRSKQVLTKLFRRHLVHGVQSIAGTSLRRGVFVPDRHGNALALSEHLQGFEKRDALDVLHKGEHVALGVAAEALVKLMILVNVKGGCLFRVKGTETQPGLPPPKLFQPHILADDFNNVDLRLQVLGEVHGDLQYDSRESWDGGISAVHSPGRSSGD